MLNKTERQLTEFIRLLKTEADNSEGEITDLDVARSLEGVLADSLLNIYGSRNSEHSIGKSEVKVSDAIFDLINDIEYGSN